MKILLLSGTPKKDGLCQSLVQAVDEGAQAGGAEVETVRLCDTDILRCVVCGDGWGSCRENHTCIYGGDGFDDVSEKIAQADAVAIVTPVYWWEVSEALKSFMDRFRRCNFGDAGRLSGKQILLAVSAGGTGNGIVKCLAELENFCIHTGAVVYDLIGVNRWNNDYKRKAAFEAARTLAAGRKNGDTVI